MNAAIAQAIERIETVMRSDHIPVTKAQLSGALQALRFVSAQPSNLSSWIDDAEEWIVRKHRHRMHCSCPICRRYRVPRIGAGRESSKGLRKGQAA